MRPDPGARGAVAQSAASPTERRSVLDGLMRVEVVLARLENAVAVAALAVAAIAMGVSVAIRVFALPVPDTGEWAIVAMSPLTFVGGALCSHLHRHLTADLVEALPAARLRRALDLLVAGLVVTFGVFFTALAWELFEYALSSGERLIDLGTPIAVPTGFMFAGAVLMTFHAVLDAIRALAGREPGGFDPWR